MNNKIAAILISYNEVDRIKYTLDSLHGFDEIYCLDKGSDDGTKDILDRYGVVTCEIPLSDDKKSVEYERAINAIIDNTECDWVMMLVCSDIVHPDLVVEIKKYISINSVDVVKVPMYRYSMGYTDDRSYYKGLHYKDILVKKCYFKNDKDIHAMTSYSDSAVVGTLFLKDKRIAVYHLTHENLDIILERHLRYAQVEAKYFTDRHEGLRQTWRDILRQCYLYFKLGTYKLGEKGKAQLCMLLLYRVAKYLNVYFDENMNNEIKNKYDRIRNNKYDDL